MREIVMFTDPVIAWWIVVGVTPPGEKPVWQGLVPTNFLHKGPNDREI
jgi:hypothetical protein